MSASLMTPKQIKRAIEDAGSTQVKVADELGVTPQLVGLVVHDKAVSHRVRCHIAKVIQVPVNRIWKIKDNPTKVGRPLSVNQVNHCAA